MFITKYEKNTRLLFNSITRKKKPDTQFSLLNWLNYLLKEFFGGFIFLNISKCKEKPYDKITKIRTYFYECSINCKLYIELILNKNIYLISDEYTDTVKKNFNNIKCVYKSIHNTNNIMDFYTNKEEEEIEYQFINVNELDL